MTTLTPAATPTRRSAGRPPSSWARRRDDLGLQLFLLPVAVVFVVLFAVPLGRSLWYSLTDFDGYSAETSFVGLANYAAVFSDSSMLAGLWFTLAYAVGTTLLVTATALPLALALDRRFFGHGFVRVAFFFPAIPSVAVLGLVWGFILNPLGSGVLNTVLDSLGGLGPVSWLSTDALAQLSVVVVGVWTQTGWHAILYLAYLQSIPPELQEVATIDGASAWQRFRFVTLPLLTPAVTISTFLLMSGGLKVYDLPFTLTGGGPGFATRTLTQSIITDGIGQAKFGEGSALAVLFMVAVGAVVLGQLALTRRAEERSR